MGSADVKMTLDNSKPNGIAIDPCLLPDRQSTELFIKRLRRAANSLWGPYRKPSAKPTAIAAE
jgi:hypothetical protein